MTYNLPSISNPRLNRDSASLLTPPLSYTSSEDIPFKPKQSDNVSLSMKKCHRGNHRRNRRRRNRACLSSNDLSQSPIDFGRETPRPYHSKSMPSLNNSQRYRSTHRSTFRTIRGSPTIGRNRRWTLPSKAAASRTIATPVTVEIERKRSNFVGDNLDSSPAMITLRRATTSKPPPRMSLTFFPPPKFSRTRSGFLSAFLESITSDYQSRNYGQMAVAQPLSSSNRSRSVSIDHDKAQPSVSIAAQPVCTQIVDIEPTLSHPDQTTATTAMRRCSTRYVSGSSIYEIVWDENASSNISEGVLSEGESIPIDRRHSVAMDKLETQLFRAVAQSRRQSLLAQEREQLEANAELMMQQSLLQQQSFQDMLSFKFSRFVNEAALQQVPRSKASVRRKKSSKRSLTEEQHTKSPDIEERSHIEFFPSLASRPESESRRSSGEATEDPKCEDIDASNSQGGAISTAETETRSARKSRRSSAFGDLIGVSSHMRRKTVGTTWAQRQRSNAVNQITSRRPSVWRQQNMEISCVTEDDTVPLISSSDIVG